MRLTPQQRREISRINPDQAARVRMPRKIRALTDAEKRDLRRELDSFWPPWPKSLFRKAYKLSGGRAITVGIGSVASGGAGAMVSGATGLYFSTTGEIGIYGSASVGVGIVASVSLSTQITVVLGPPSKFMGDCLAVSVSAGELMVLGISLILETTAPHDIFGAAVSVGIGFGVLPIEWTIEAQRTWRLTRVP